MKNPTTAGGGGDRYRKKGLQAGQTIPDLTVHEAKPERNLRDLEYAVADGESLSITPA